MRLNVFIPHRWNYEDYKTISELLDKTKYSVSDYSVPKTDPFISIDSRFKVDPQIKKQIKYANVVVCSNRPANNNGIAIEEIKYAKSINKPVIAVKVTDNNSHLMYEYNIKVIPCRKYDLENWLSRNIK